MQISISAVFLLFICVSESAIAANPQPITTDRPDFTESAITLLKNEFQLEAGATIQWSADGNSTGLPEALLRYGFTDVVELRLQFPDYNLTRLDHDRDQGFGDSQAGLAIRLGPLPNGDEMTIMPEMNFPTGAQGFSNDSLDPEVRLCWSHDVDDDWSLSMMGFALWTTVNDTRSIFYQQTVSLEHRLLESLGAFWEYAGNFSDRLRVQHVAHTGLAYAVSFNSQADIHGGYTTNGDEAAPFLGAGYSYRFN